MSRMVAGDVAPPPGASGECCDLLRAMLRPDPAARPTMAQVLAHPWLRGDWQP